MKTIGIIGGGQLGRMLAMAAARLNLRTVILEPQADCPAAQTATRQIVGAYDDDQALDALAAACDLVTYEFENVPVAAAARLARSLPVFPPPKALEVAQDRVTEKRFLNACGLETARFHAVDSLADLKAALAAFGGQGVLKTRRLGYDGKGQHVFRDDADDPAAVYAALGAVPLILESFVRFEREISIIAARGQDGSVLCFDPAENVHRNGILATSTVPAALPADLAAAPARRRRRSSMRSTMLASSEWSSSLPPTAGSPSTRSRRGCTIPATGRKQPVSSRNSNSTCAPWPACRWATLRAIRTASCTI